MSIQLDGGKKYPILIKTNKKKESDVTPNML